MIVQAEGSLRPGREVRRNLILARSAELFAGRGYAAIGVADIGAAVGITASGVYRYFDGKAAIMLALLEQHCRRMVDQAEAIVAVCEPELALAELVRWHAAESVTQSRVFGVCRREFLALPQPDQATLRELRCRYLDLWLGALNAARPELEPLQVHVLALGALTLLDAAGEGRTPMEDSARADVIAAQAWAALNVTIST